MTNTSVSPPTPGISPQDHVRLLDAAREALAWFERFDRHAPSDMHFGGEAKIRKQLRTVIRLASFELRLCVDCGGGGTVPGPTSHPMERPAPSSCLTCGGSGERKVYSYGSQKRTARGS